MQFAHAEYYPAGSPEITDQETCPGVFVLDTLVATPEELGFIRDEIRKWDGNVRARSLTGEGKTFPGNKIDAFPDDAGNVSPAYMIVGELATQLMQAAKSSGMSAEKIIAIKNGINAQKNSLKLPQDVADKSGITYLAKVHDEVEVEIPDVQPVERPAAGRVTTHGRHRKEARQHYRHGLLATALGRTARHA